MNINMFVCLFVPPEQYGGLLQHSTTGEERHLQLPGQGCHDPVTARRRQTLQGRPVHRQLGPQSSLAPDPIPKLCDGQPWSVLYDFTVNRPLLKL